MLDNNEKLREIVQLSTELNRVQDLDILLEKILFEARSFLNADAGSIQIKEGNELIFSHVQTDSMQSKLPPGQKLIYSSFRIKINKSSLSGYAASTGKILNIPDAHNIPDDTPYSFDPSYDKKSGYITKSILTIPLKNSRNEVLGVMQIINSLRNYKDSAIVDDDFSKVGPFNKSDEQLALHFANTASMILQRAQMTRALILRMISMAELRDPKETGAHVNRVASYSTEIYERWANKRKIDKNEIEREKDTLRMAAMLHDVGKVAISDLILKKPAKFTPDEFEIMKKHTVHGASLFRNIQSKLDEMAAVVALNHHENWDGSGYPGYVDPMTGEPTRVDKNGKPLAKKGEEIPLYGRIVALADVFDALSSKRVYKDAWGEEDVLQEIKKMRGVKFDPELVDIFFESYDYIKSITTRYPDHE